MPFPDLPPDRIPGSPGHLNDHQLIDQGLDYIQQQAYRDDPDFPPLPDVPVLGQSGHVTAHDRILAVLEYVKTHPSVGAFSWATVSNTPTGTYKGDDGQTYAYYLFEADGTLTVTTAGLLEVLIVSGGGGSKGAGQGLGDGVGGYVVTGLHPFNANALPVTVGKGGTASKQLSTAMAGPSSLGSLATGSGAFGIGTAGPGLYEPFTSNITGQPLQVSGDLRNNTPSYGAGGYLSGTGGGNGQPGVVIARTRLN